MRCAWSIPPPMNSAPLDIDVYVSDDIGSSVGPCEIAELVRVCAPICLEFGLRNTPNIYPAGTHLESTAVALTRERSRRARIGYDMLKRLDPNTILSPLPQTVSVWEMPRQGPPSPALLLSDAEDHYSPAAAPTPTSKLAVGN